MNKSDELHKDLFHDAPITDGESLKDTTTIRLRCADFGHELTVFDYEIEGGELIIHVEVT